MDFGHRGAQLLRQAEQLTTEPVRFQSAHLAGFVEFVAPDENGRCWIGGWMRDEVAEEEGILLVDRRKWPGTCRFARHDRDDVPAGATGFIGLLQSEWRPGPGTTDVFLMLAEAKPLFLRALNPLRVVPMRDVAAIIEQMEDRRPRGHFEALRRTLLSPESWTPVSPEAAGFAVHAGLDVVTVVPGFGCVVEGWALSPAKAVADFSLRLDDVVIVADPAGTRRRARPDLAGAFPALAPVAATAGFVALFRHAAELRPGAGAALKLVFADGTSTTHPIEPGQIVWAERGLGEGELLRAYPAIEFEPFAPELAGALDGRARATAAAPRAAVPPRPSPVTIFRGVGADRAEVFRLFDELLSQRRRLEAAGVGVAVIGRETELDSLLPLFHGFANAFGGPCNLFLAEDDAPPIEPMLHLLGCQRFALLGPWHRLPDATLEAVLRHLMDAAPRAGVIHATGGAPAGRAGTTAAPPGPAASLGEAARTGRGRAPSELRRRIAALVPA